MIIVDTSALMAIALGEPEAAACRMVLASDPDILISAGTMAEALIVAGRRGVSPEMASLLTDFVSDTVTVTAASARLSGEAYGVWGKGNHPAGLNYGDCFAYALAKDRGCPLLFIGNDFSQTDVLSAL